MKDFDRHIERSMNEFAVAPPFGMWNRIQGELDGTQPEAVPAPVASPMAPRGVLVGFMAGAALIGLLVGGYFMYNSTNTEVIKPNQSGISRQNTSTNRTGNDVQVMPIEVPQKQPQTVQPSIVSIPVANKPVLASVNNVEEHSTQTLSSTVKHAVTDGQASVGEQENNVGSDNNNYYFPPVDIATSETSNNEEIVSALYRGYNSVDPNADTKITEPKKTRSSSDSRVKFKIKRKPRGGFSYGRLNRLKPSKN